jgi:hypothetical protein
MTQQTITRKGKASAAALCVATPGKCARSARPWFVGINLSSRFSRRRPKYRQR